MEAMAAMEDMENNPRTYDDSNSDDEDDVPEVVSGAPNAHGFFTARNVLTFMLFLGMANAYIMRTNMTVAMTVLAKPSTLHEHVPFDVDECGSPPSTTQTLLHSADGPFMLDTSEQWQIFSAFIYGNMLSQIPFGLLSKRFGAKTFLGVGMLVNSLLSFLVPILAEAGVGWLSIIRFIQGVGEGAMVPCTHVLLAKWSPPKERSRLGTYIYSGAQFGTAISILLGGLLAQSEFLGGWPSIFYIFSALALVWSIAFFCVVYESPDQHYQMHKDEWMYIKFSLWGRGRGGRATSDDIPWLYILTSLPFWAILFAHMGQAYGYHALMTELPTFLKQVSHFDITSSGLLCLPYIAMWLFSIASSHVVDYLLSRPNVSRTTVRRAMNSIGQFLPALCLFIASYGSRCNPSQPLTLLMVGAGLNGGIHSSFMVNHLDIAPRFAGVLMSITNCLANLAGLLAPIVAGHIIGGSSTQASWRKIFYIAAELYVVSGTFYLLFASARRQPWDNPRSRRSQSTNTTQSVEMGAINDLASPSNETSADTSDNSNITENQATQNLTYVMKIMDPKCSCDADDKAARNNIKTNPIAGASVFHDVAKDDVTNFRAGSSIMTNSTYVFYCDVDL